ncbi:unnamed protein product [Calicophoron daubneyi]|uniref:Solute carrier organic anion transporter family member n=1 Tax=Calicophoron daubneyi TaxID=300641 RepID=A0AAV2TD87_CALDB
MPTLDSSVDNSEPSAELPPDVNSDVRLPINWNTNVVNFISNCGHPGLVRRTSFGACHAPDRASNFWQQHRRNLSAATTVGVCRIPETPDASSKHPYSVFFNMYPQSNNFNSYYKPNYSRQKLFGHARNISDPTSGWECYRVDVKPSIGPQLPELPVLPLLQTSQRHSTTFPDDYSAELKSQTSPYVPSWQGPYSWEEIDGLKKPVEITQEKEKSHRIIPPDEQCLLVCLQPFATPVTVLIGLFGIMFIQTMVISGLISSMLTTLERRFNFTTRQVGYIFSCFEGSGVITTVVISFLNGQRTNRLRTVGITTLLLSLGFALFALPHFLIGPYNPDNLSSDSSPSLRSNSSLSSLIHLILPSFRSSNLSFTNGTTPAIVRPAMITQTLYTLGTKSPNLYSGQSSTAEPLLRGASQNPVHTLALSIFCIAMVLAGVGASPLHVLAPTYLWDNLSNKQYPIYSALFYSAGGLGPACGFLAGAGFLSIYIDFPVALPRRGLDRNKPLWLGAWWLGMLVCAAITFLVALPVIAFPKRLADKAVTSDTEIPAEANDDDKDDEKSKSACISRIGGRQNECEKAKSLDRKINSNDNHYDTKIWSNRVGPVSLLQTADNRATSESAISMRAYLKMGRFEGSEPQLGRTKSLTCTPAKRCETVTVTLVHSSFTSVLSTIGKRVRSAVVVPSSLTGVLTGALLMRHYRPSIDRTLAGVSIVIGVTVFTTISLMLIGCPSNRVAGLTATYDGKPWPWMYGPARLMPPNLTAACNIHSSSSLDRYYNQKRNIYACSFSHFHPVCWKRSKLVEETDLPLGVKGPGPSHLTFFNPCFAGCESDVVQKNYHSGTLVEDFTQCRCLGKTFLNPSGNRLVGINGTVYDYSHVTSGRCPADCPQYSAFLAILFLHILCTGMLQNPSNVTTLSCVSPEDSSVALGLQIFFLRTLAYIPAPIYFGQLFDLVCQYRLVGGDRSAGAIYRSSDNRQTQIGACLQYNLEGLPLVWLGMVLALKLISLTGSTLTWKAARYRASKSQQHPKSAATSAPADLIPTHSQCPPSPVHLNSYPRTEFKKELTQITELGATTPSDSTAVCHPEFRDPPQV